MWIVGAPARDVAGHVSSVNAPLAGCDQVQPLAELLAGSPDTPVVLDGVYRNQDEEYLDARALDRLMSRGIGK